MVRWVDPCRRETPRPARLVAMERLVVAYCPLVIAGQLLQGPLRSAAFLETQEAAREDQFVFPSGAVMRTDGAVALDNRYALQTRQSCITPPRRPLCGRRPPLRQRASRYSCQGCTGNTVPMIKL